MSKKNKKEIKVRKYELIEATFNVDCKCGEKAFLMFNNVDDIERCLNCRRRYKLIIKELD